MAVTLVDAESDIGIEQLAPMAVFADTIPADVGALPRQSEIELQEIRDTCLVAIASGEEIAAHVLLRLQSKAMHVPEQFSLVTWSGSAWAQAAAISLNAAEVPVKKMVMTTRRILHGEAKHVPRPPCTFFRALALVGQPWMLGHEKNAQDKV